MKSDDAVLYMVEQAFRHFPKMTSGMLQAMLTSRVSAQQRERALARLAREGKIACATVRMSSYGGRSSQVSVWHRVERIAADVGGGGHVGSDAGVQGDATCQE